MPNFHMMYHLLFIPLLVGSFAFYLLYCSGSILFFLYLFHFLFHVLVLLVLSCHFLVLLGSFVFLPHTLVLWLILVSVFNLFGVELLSLYAVIMCIFV